MKKIQLFVLFVLLVVSVSCVETPSGYQDMTPEQAQAAIAGNQNVRILDIRTPAEFNNGHIQGAFNIDYYAPDFKNNLSKLDKDATYLVYCRSGNRSGKSMQIFKELGFKQIQHLKNGINAWVGQGMPLVR